MSSTKGQAERGYVLLINPRYRRNPCSSAMRHALTPALALPTIAAATPQSYRVRLHDENLAWGEPPLVPIPEVVGITVHTAFAPRAYELARRYRALGSRVVLGGLHATALPEEARCHADVVVAGEGASVWPQVLAGLRAGRLGPAAVVQGSFRSPPYESCPWPRRDLLPRGAFVTRASIVATRGCTQRCGLCYLATRGLRMPYQKRPVADVLAEIDATGERFVVFTDNNLMADPGYGLALCRALGPRGLLWTAAATIEVARHPQLVREMAAAGCQGVFIGLETLSDATLRSRLDPHLLFNTLNLIAELCRDDPAEAERCVVRLSGLLRAALDRAEQPLVALGHELDLCADYLDLCRARFGSRLEVHIDRDEGADSARVPPLAVQALCENAVRHGIERRPQGGTVRLHSRVLADEVEIRVLSPGPFRGERPGGLGLDLTRRRLALAFRGTAHLDVGTTDEGDGTQARLRLPRRGEP
ncbi:MAG: histidine kinase [Deltaproteobacteria bacterium]|nr:histidine kinase [Deltaproteobacteria bacterium]